MSAFLKSVIVGVVLFLICASPAGASQVAGQWWFGEWRCTIDGRPARMSWRVVDDPQTQCQGNVCSTSSGVKVVGRFSDNGSRWVPLTSPQNSGAMLRFRHADGNRWQLTRSNANLAVGNTVWQGRQFPLSCQRA